MLWLCQCACGKRKNILGASLRNGRTKTCGCGIGSPNKVFKKTHGKSDNALYRRWVGMRARCTQKTHPSYKYYGARGIKVCPRWESFENFDCDMGAGFDEGLELDRKDNDGHYEPGNCRWVSGKTNCRNRSSNHFFEISGERKTITEWAEESGIHKSALRHRINQGWPPDRILLAPIKQRQKKQNT